MAVMLKDTTLEKIRRAMKCYPDKRSACMSALRIAQLDDPENRLTEQAFRHIADLLDMTPVSLHEMAKFYTMYNLEPVGKYHIQVCANISCSLLGAEHIIRHIERILNIKVGETTQDNKFTLSTVECLGSCGTAPMMQINQEYYEDLTEDKVGSILDSLE